VLTGILDAVALLLCVMVWLPVVDPLWEGVVVVVCVRVNDGVLVLLFVCVTDAVAEAVPECVRVCDGLCDGVIVMLFVWVPVCVMVAELVPVCVMVTELVPVCVMDGVGEAEFRKHSRRVSLLAIPAADVESHT
jgi:hypothetical protein